MPSPDRSPEASPETSPDASRRGLTPAQPEPTWLGSGSGYLSVLALGPVLALMAHHVWPDQPTLRGQPLSVIAAFAAVAVALVLWLRSGPVRPQDWPVPVRLLLATLAVLWATTVALSVLHGDLFDLSTVLVPIALAMLWLKRPTPAAGRTALDAWGVGIIVIAVAAMALDFAGIVIIRPEGIVRWPLQVLHALGIDSRATVPLEEIEACHICYGYVGRWAGPFGNVNYAGPVGATLVMIGLFRPAWRRWVFTIAGLGIIVLSDSRTSLTACLAGLVALALAAPSILGRPVRPWFRWLVLAGLVVGVVGYIGLIDRTFNLRTDVWVEFLRTWPRSPFTGVGEHGIQALISAGDLPGWASHGHSVLVDPLLRFGVIGVVLIVAVFALLLVVTVRAARTGLVLPLVLVATALGAGLTEDLIDWRYLGLELIPLILAAVIAADALRASGTATRTGEPTTRLDATGT